MSSDPKKAVETLKAVLVNHFAYKALPADKSAICRKFFSDRIPAGFEDAHKSLKTTRGTTIATGFNRIVVGDYGAFIEVRKDQICPDNIHCMPGQEYRITNPKFKHAKYHWLTAKDTSDCKIYHQMKTVGYADYKPGMYYFDPFEVIPF